MNSLLSLDLKPDLLATVGAAYAHIFHVIPIGFAPPKNSLIVATPFEQNVQNRVSFRETTGQSIVKQGITPHEEFFEALNQLFPISEAQQWYVRRQSRDIDFHLEPLEPMNLLFQVATRPGYFQNDELNSVEITFRNSHAKVRGVFGKRFPNVELFWSLFFTGILVEYLQRFSEYWNCSPSEEGNYLRFDPRNA